jgi:hypothetical protein
MTSLSKPTPKKRGRPLGSKNKRVRKVAGREYTFKDKEFKQSSTDAAIHKLMDANLSLIKDNNQLLKVINNLEHQIIGFRAVVSYLEVQAGLKVTQ